MDSSRHSRLLAGALALTATALVACGGGQKAGSMNEQGSMSDQTSMDGSSAMVDPSAEAQKIKELDQQWVQAVGQKDAAATAAFYAEDGRIMPPDAPASVGRDAVQKTWAGFLKLPDLSLTFAPDTVAVSGDGTIAYDIGSYDMAYTGDSGPVKDHGKYVVVWVKKQGQWKVMADIFNSDGAPSGM